MRTRRRMENAGRAFATGLPVEPSNIGLDEVLYASALSFLFDREVPEPGGEEWYWSIDQDPFDASPLEWTRVQTVVFANAGRDLQPFSDEQVGMGLYYVISNNVSDVPFAAIHESVPLDEAMLMMRAMPELWRQCIGPRLAKASSQQSQTRRLSFACFMWFDVWPTFWNVKHIPQWRDAVWQVLDAMLDVPCREVQMAALHGIGHEGHVLDRRQAIDARIERFLRGVAPDDTALREYAQAARLGMVQ